MVLQRASVNILDPLPSTMWYGLNKCLWFHSWDSGGILTGKKCNVLNINHLLPKHTEGPKVNKGQHNHVFVYPCASLPVPKANTVCLIQVIIKDK